jgi:hypothetical protein
VIAALAAFPAEIGCPTPGAVARLEHSGEGAAEYVLWRDTLILGRLIYFLGGDGPCVRLIRQAEDAAWAPLVDAAVDALMDGRDPASIVEFACGGHP